MDLLLLIAAIAAGVWLFWFALRTSPVAGCLVFLLAAACFSYPFLTIEGPIPLTIDRLAILLAAGIYILHRGLGLTDPKPLAAADKLLLAFLAVLTISTFTHNYSGVFPPAEACRRSGG